MPADTTNQSDISSYQDHVQSIQEWLQDTADSAIASPESRDWCTLEINDNLNASTMYDYFDNSQVNQDFQTEYDTVNGTADAAGTFTNKPIMYNQAESDALDGLAKMFIYRHQPRLKNYRDDLENKSIRTYTSLSLALSRYALLQSVNQT